MAMLSTSKFLKGLVLTILLMLFCYYYLWEAIKQHTDQLTNTAKYEVKVDKISPPTLTICIQPKWKINNLEKVLNATEDIFYSGEELPLNYTMYQVFSEGTFQLNKDYAMYFYDDLTLRLRPLFLGYNNLGSKLDFEVKSVKGMNNGQCYAIIPCCNGTMLTPGTFIRFIFWPNSKGTDQIKTASLTITSQEDDYLYRVWTGLPGVKPEEMKIDAEKTMGLTIWYDQVEHEYIKDCTMENGHSVFQDFARKITENTDLYNCSKICIPIAVAEILDTIEHDWEYCQNLQDYYCMSSSETLDAMSELSQTSTKRCLTKGAIHKPRGQQGV